MVVVVFFEQAPLTRDDEKQGILLLVLVPISSRLLI